MSKLLEDPKVQNLVSVAVTKAEKAAAKTTLTLVKNTVADTVSQLKEDGAKDAAKAVAAMGKELIAQLKAA